MQDIRIVNITHPNLETETLEKVSIDISEGKVKKVYKEGDEPGAFNGRVINGAGLTILPGLCDVHVHFRDPGFTYKEDIESGARVAARGGFTEIGLMANTKPTVSDVETLKYVLQKTAKENIKIHTCATVTKDLQGQVLTDMEALKSEGAIGFTDDGIPIMDESVLAKALTECKRLNVTISLHEEDKSFIKENGINHGKASNHFKIYGSPSEAEYSIVARDIEVLRASGGTMLIQHISTKEAVDLVRKGRAEGLSLFAEATPHHIALTEDAVIEYGVNAKMNPPLRTEEDRNAIIKGLQDGAISIISTDHAPHAEYEKNVEITKAPSGILGLETSFSVCYEALVKSGALSIFDLIKKMAVNPRKLYNLPVPEVKEGSSADFAIVNLNEKWIYKDSFSKSKNSPFFNKELTGKVKYTICEGNIVYED